MSACARQGIHERESHVTTLLQPSKVSHGSRWFETQLVMVSIISQAADARSNFRGAGLYDLGMQLHHG